MNTFESIKINGDYHKKRTLLSEAIKSGEILKIKYEGGSNPGGAREICPIEFEWDHKVKALCLKSNEERTFFIDKIKFVSDKEYDLLLTKKTKSMDSNKLDKSGKETRNGCIGMVVLVIIVVIAIATMCTGSDKTTHTTTILDTIDSMKLKQKESRINDINMIIEKNITLKNISDSTTFKAYIINEYEAYFNMQKKWVENSISDKAKEKFPNSFQDQNEYCENHNCKIINYESDPIMEGIITDFNEYHIDEISQAVTKLYSIR